VWNIADPTIPGYNYAYITIVFDGRLVQTKPEVSGSNPVSE
jgi:hypothetical protein